MTAVCLDMGHLPQRSAQLWTLAVSSLPLVATLLSVQAEDEAGWGGWICTVSTAMLSS